MGVLQIIEHVCVIILRLPTIIYSRRILQSFAFAANRSYHSFAGIDFLNGPERRCTIRQSRLASQYEQAPSISDATVPLNPLVYSNQASPGPLFANSNSPYREYHSYNRAVASQNSLYSGISQHRWQFFRVLITLELGEVILFLVMLWYHL